MGRVPAVIELTDEEERDLRQVLKIPSALQEQAMRARIVLRAAEGASNTEIAGEIGVSLNTVGLWQRNFSEGRMDGLETAPRSGRPREISDAEIQLVLAKTLEAPPDGTTQRSHFLGSDSSLPMPVAVAAYPGGGRGRRGRARRCEQVMSAAVTPARRRARVRWR